MDRLRAEVFLGKVNDPSIGEWYKLPMKQDELEKILFSKENYIISDYSCDLNIYLNEYAKNDLLDLNELLNINSKALTTIYMWADQNLKQAKEILAEIDKDCYIYAENITDGPEHFLHEQLGEVIVNRGLLGYIPQQLIDKDYIDFVKIGRDFWLGSSIWYEPSTESIFLQYKSR